MFQPCSQCFHHPTILKRFCSIKASESIQPQECQAYTSFIFIINPINHLLYNNQPQFILLSCVYEDPGFCYPYCKIACIIISLSLDMHREHPTRSGCLLLLPLKINDQWSSCLQRKEALYFTGDMDQFVGKQTSILFPFSSNEFDNLYFLLSQ